MEASDNRLPLCIAVGYLVNLFLAVANIFQFIRQNFPCHIWSIPNCQMSLPSGSHSWKTRRYRRHIRCLQRNFPTPLKIGEVYLQFRGGGIRANGTADSVQFQELVLASKLVFIAGIEEAKSKGRGEECISQNLRILQSPNGLQTMLFFTNSQRREAKRYVSIPISCIASVNPGKKTKKPVILQLQPNFDLLSQMKVLQIQFLDDSGMYFMCHMNLPMLITFQIGCASVNFFPRRKSDQSFS